MSRPIKFTRTPVTAALIRQCVDRAVRLHLAAGGTDDRISLEMDLSAANANGCPMDFERLLSFDDGSFLHDITGIQNNISRISGRMTGHFLPRAAIGARP